MNIPLADTLHLLHSVSHGVLATHANQMPGYPYASVLPFALDEHHCPVFLISALAEHTKNLLADSRASLVAYSEGNGRVLAGARVTLLGEVERCHASDRLLARYLRYQPEAERYLALSDFAFFRFEPRRLRAIAGFGEMGWIEAQAWLQASWLSLEEEGDLVRQAGGAAGSLRLLGVDPYGADVVSNGIRERQKFLHAPLRAEALSQAVRRALEA